jgi:hypothetical protein
MKYSKPEVTSAGSALVAVQLQSESSKGEGVADRVDLEYAGPTNSISVPAAYEADE